MSYKTIFSRSKTHFSVYYIIHRYWFIQNNRRLVDYILPSGPVVGPNFFSLISRLKMFNNWLCTV